MILTDIIRPFNGQNLTVVGAFVECLGLLDVLLHHGLGGRVSLVLGTHQQNRSAPMFFIYFKQSLSLKQLNKSSNMFQQSMNKSHIKKAEHVWLVQLSKDLNFTFSLSLQSTADLTAIQIAMATSRSRGNLCGQFQHWHHGAPWVWGHH